MCECVCGSPVPIETGPSLDQNLAWHMLPATATARHRFYQVDWRMTSKGPIVKKHFPFFFRSTLEIPDWHYVCYISRMADGGQNP